jgi:WD40 repeat protein
VWNALTSQKTHAIKLHCPWVIPNQEARLITSSGDHTCVLWDVTTGQRISIFGGEFLSGHTTDVQR